MLHKSDAGEVISFHALTLFSSNRMTCGFNFQVWLHVIIVALTTGGGNIAQGRSSWSEPAADSPASETAFALPFQIFDFFAKSFSSSLFHMSI